jgi:hypothetical protein
VASSNKSDRRAAVDKIRRDQKRADQRQGRVIVGVCILIAVAIIGIAAFRPVTDWWAQRGLDGKSLNQIGAGAKVCQPRVIKAATGVQDHVAPGVDVKYTDAPPAFGQHEQSPDTITRKLYTKKDRPRVEMLVHNLEHGYTILWYDQTIADDQAQMNELSAIADKLQGADDYRLKFKAVPWLKSDGKAFPKGQHVALTHWAKTAAAEDAKIAAAAKVTDSAGVWTYCSAVSGAGLKDFMATYPYLNSPEPTAQ